MTRRAGLLSLLAVLAGLGAAGSGCTLERRGDPELLPDGEGGPEGSLVDSLDQAVNGSLRDSILHAMGGGLRDAAGLPLPHESADPDASVRMTLEVFREAVQVGDISLALQLLHPEAVLLDDLVAEGDATRPGTRGEQLLALRRRHADGLGFRVVDSELRWVGDAALLTTRLLLTERSPDPDTGNAVAGWARESVVLAPSPEGWRILHLHRSLGQGRPPEPPGER